MDDSLSSRTKTTTPTLSQDFYTKLRKVLKDKKIAESVKDGPLLIKSGFPHPYNLYLGNVIDRMTVRNMCFFTATENNKNSDELKHDGISLQSMSFAPDRFPEFKITTPEELQALVDAAIQAKENTEKKDAIVIETGSDIKTSFNQKEKPIE